MEKLSFKRIKQQIKRWIFNKFFIEDITYDLNANYKVYAMNNHQYISYGDYLMEMNKYQDLVNIHNILSRECNRYRIACKIICDSDTDHKMLYDNFGNKYDKGSESVGNVLTWAKLICKTALRGQLPEPYVPGKPTVFNPRTMSM